MFAPHAHLSPASRSHFTRRRFLRDLSMYSAAGAAGLGLGGSLPFGAALAADAQGMRKRGKAMIVLWMAGAPSQMETFSPKPDHTNGGGTETIQTAIPGVEFAAGWEKMAAAAGDLAVIRSMTNNEGNHQRASYQLHTGYSPTGSVRHPSVASGIVQQIAPEEFNLPASVTIGNGGNNLANIGGGFLGVQYDPLTVPRAGQLPSDVRPAQGELNERRVRSRLSLMNKLDSSFAARGGGRVVENHREIYQQAGNLMLDPNLDVFTLDDEPQEVKDSYGDSEFGRGCLLARRLVESGVTYVEVRMGGWDTHDDNFERVKNNASQVDPAFSTLIADLKSRGLLDDTLVLWTGEFGRTPKVNARGGRDHFPKAFNSVLAGGGVRGGQVIGSTTADGMAVEDRPVKVDDLLRSCCHALGVDADHEHMSPLGRPLRVVDKGEVVQELFS
ncbi:DUF1501 domain-containing protein [Alienimonas chondri]|uniref:DUF1501 domain-containing protein n=1 Tax=Alienimonas chondri TaxID=2681879 RepID=A0ABX1VD99_9PLAN|nr:DUF1501 domain-containing protein [Alienimonas chondri]NNJ25890.1 hypothetical protein [Alienimonas chondri]